MAPKGSEATRKSARNVSDEAPKSWDEKQRERGRIARLAMLERDNHHTDNTHMMKVQNLADDEIVGGGDTKKKRKKASLAERTRNRTLDQALVDGAADMVTEFGVSYHDIVSAPPPAHAEGRHLCSMCGFASAYTCRITGMRLCSKTCYRAHDQTKLKGLKR
mmetsp:Transcript_38643/g.62286  ORF Transcript_38643/g.62286 Transcript_38643/m.62286 type:complete len:162 (+) Transcript_38643:74-559(+)|eukprot:CAMPEP_0179443762 /NCGR_PEP_ID=MMETSP0799-20121207/27224_1 /TAXON_ID=46947 /ORGANISM="Geminigera cryophila, Strain CCMP2564" /LENGTH=161 /DNA_ID=CAMNT_0021230161 /DNA_START=74 /DNA_END=559 /DNA_ORIENTATION=+